MIKYNSACVARWARNFAVCIWHRFALWARCLACFTVFWIVAGQTRLAATTHVFVWQPLKKYCRWVYLYCIWKNTAKFAWQGFWGAQIWDVFPKNGHFDVGTLWTLNWPIAGCYFAGILDSRNTASTFAHRYTNRKKKNWSLCHFHTTIVFWTEPLFFANFEIQMP